MTSRILSIKEGWRVLATTLAVVLMLAACTTTTRSGPAEAAGPAATPIQTTTPGERKDRLTASDEPESIKRARVRMELASAYFSRGQLTTALDEVKMAIVADPNTGSAFNLRGLIYASLGDHRLAEESFRHALTLDARDVDTMQNFGWYLCQQKRYDEAQTLFNRALALPEYRDSPRTLMTQGICYARAGNWTEAERSLQRSYELDPGNPTTAVNLTEVLVRRGDFERARFYIRRVNSSTELVNAQTLWLAARVEHKLGNRQGEQEFGAQLRNRFPQSREAAAFEQGHFDD